MLKRITVLIAVVFIALMGSQNTYADSISGFNVTQYSEEDAMELYNEVVVAVSSTYTTDKYSDDKVTSFDVSENNILMIGIEGNGKSGIFREPNDHILIFDDSNLLVCCIEHCYRDNGDLFVRWNGENILIFENSGSYIIELSTDGMMVAAYDVDITDQNNNSIWRQMDRENKRTQNGITYKMEKSENGLLIDEYTCITATSADGESKVVFDIENYGATYYSLDTVKFVISAGIGAMIFLTVYVILINKRKKSKNIER